MATCWSCERIKGKRACPANDDALICSKCCGTKRGVSIQCPSDCSYLHGADPNWHSDTQQKEDTRFLSRFFTLDESQLVFLLFLHHVLLTARTRFGAVQNDELGEIVAVTAKTLSTRSKGIVYNHPTSSLQLDKQVEWLAQLLSDRRKLPQAPEASDQDVVTVLSALDHAIRDHAAEPSRGPYLDAAAKVLRSSLEQAPPIELPGESSEAPQSNLIVPP